MARPGTTLSLFIDGGTVLVIANAIGVDSGASLTAMSLMPSLVGWWDAGLGVQLASGSVTNGNDFAHWTLLDGVTCEAGYADPDGGSAATKMLETATTGYHRLFGPTMSSVAAGPMGFTWYVKAIGGRDNAKFDTTNLGWINLATGAETVVTAGCTIDATAIGDWWRIAAYNPNQAADNNHQLLSTVGATSSFAGDVAKGLYLYNFVLTQHRCSAQSDQSGHGYSFAQTTAANQPFVQLQNGTSPGGNTVAGKAAIWQPNNSSRYTTCTTAGLLASLNSVNTYIARVQMLATPSLTLQLLGVAGSEGYSYGVDSALKPYIAGSSTVTAPDALDITAPHTLGYAYDPATGTATILVDGVAVVTGDAGIRSVGATSVVRNVKCCATLNDGIAGAVMSTSQVLAVHNALAAGR